MDRLTKQTAYANDRVNELEALESKVENINSMIQNVTEEGKTDPTANFRKAIKAIQVMN